MLTQEILKQHVDYAPETGIFTRKITTSSNARAGTKLRTPTKNRYLTIGIIGQQYYAHRLAWLYMYGTWPNNSIDHINRQRSDNRIENLREATQAENMSNVTIRRDNKSGYRGVFYNTRLNKWGARCRVKGVYKHLGLFSNKYEASQAYETYAKEVKGVFYRPPERSWQSDVRDFHEKFSLSYDGPIRQLPDDVARFRIKFMQEELDEFAKATTDGDIAGQLDALADLLYVILGTAYLSGFPFQAAWDEVHSCNMMKVKAGPNGEGSKRGSPHDVIKPEGWKGPNYAKILTQ